MKFVKDSVIYNTKTSTKIGRRLRGQFEDIGKVYETLYLSENKRYYLLVTSGSYLFSHPTDVKVLSNDEAFHWAVEYLSADTVEEYFSDKIKEG